MPIFEKDIQTARVFLRFVKKSTKLLRPLSLGVNVKGKGHHLFRGCSMKNKSSWKMLAAAVLVLILVGCTTGSVPPTQMVHQNDHAGLSTWYEQEAVTLRARAEEMRQMAKSYEQRMTKPKQNSALVQHCRNLSERYSKAAEEAQALAKLHTEQQMDQ